MTEHPKQEIPNPPDQKAEPPSETTQQISELEAKLKEQEAKYLYLYAEFDNFKKRAQKERLDLLKFGWESIARDLLQILDHLELALEHTPPGTDKNLTDGLTMVLTQFKSALEKNGVQRVETQEKPFDPNFHEAVSQEVSDGPVGKILKEFRSGYTLHGRLLRPARVAISQGKSLSPTS